MRRAKRGSNLVALAVTLFVPHLLFAAEVMYVQAVKGELREGPRMNAPKVAAVKRGDSLEILRKEGIWFEAKAAKAKGWISRLFLSNHKPIGQPELMQDVPETLEKASRRRSSSYAVSASARGLMGDERVRHGRELYRSDYDALEKMERYQVSPAKLEKFLSSAKLSDQ